MFKNRDYQDNYITDLREFLKSKVKYGIGVLPTGAGKSICIAQTAAIVGRCIVLQPSKELLKQNYEKYTAYGFKAGMVSSSMGVKKTWGVTFATIGSINNPTMIRIFKEVWNIKYIIIDECHLATDIGQSIHSFCEKLGIEKVIGLTASPVKLKSSMNGSNVHMIHRLQDNMFKSIFHVTQIGKLVQDGHWARIVYHERKQNRSFLVLNSSGTDFTQKSMEKYYYQNDLGDKIYQLIDWALNKKGKRSILVFTISVNDALILEKRIPGTRAIYGDMDAKLRDQYIEDFKKRKIHTLINVNVLGVGFDFPGLEVIIHARPTNSVNIWYQHIGRLVRPFGDKIGIVVDLSGNLERFGRIEDFVFMQHWNTKMVGWGMFSGNKLLTGYDPRELKWNDRLYK